MGFFNKELKELFDFSSKERPKVVADEIQAGVEEAGKGRGLGVQTKKRKTPNFSLSGAGQNLYGASEEALAKQEEMRKATQSEGITNILSAVMKDTENETQKYLPKGDTLGEATYLTKEEKKQRSIVDYTVTKEKPEFKASGLNIEQSYKDYAEGGSKAIADYNPNYGEVATKAATPFTHIVFHHTASGKKEKDDKVVEAGQRLNPKGEQLGYHFYVGRDLKIRQAAPLNKRTNHVGGTNRYFERASKIDTTFTEEQAIALLKDKKNAFNENSIGIGFIAANDKDINPKQIEIGMKLAEALSGQFNINPENVGGHGHLKHQKRRPTEGTTATKAWRKLKNLKIHKHLQGKGSSRDFSLGNRPQNLEYKPALSTEDVKERVLAFQRLHDDLVNDGKLGPKTKEKMKKVGYKLNE